MKNALIVMTLAVISCAVAAVAQAGKRGLALDQGDLLAGESATVDTGYGITAPDGANSIVGLTFTLPPNFKENSVAKLQFWFVSPASACNVDIVALGTVRLRSDTVRSIQSSPQSGFTAVVAGVTPLPVTANRVFSKVFRLAAATAGPVLGQRAGDLITVSFRRVGADASDTCTGALTAASAKLIYTTR